MAEVLSIKIEHSKPLELKLFTASMLCIESQYKRYLSQQGIRDDEYRLCVNEVKKGSIIIDFVKKKAVELFAHELMSGFLEKYLKPKIEAIIEQKIEEETGYTLPELKEILAIVSAVADDYKSNIDLNVHIGDKVTAHYSFNGVQATAIAAECSRRINNLPSESEIKHEVTLHWKQASDEDKSLSIDKGIIEEIENKKKVKIICDENLKKEMVSSNEDNLFNLFYIVDVEVKRISGKPIAYIIRKIHDKGKLDTEK